MEKMIYLITFILNISLAAFCQEAPLTPLNHQADASLLKSETYIMDWLIIRDTIEIKIGEVETQIQKKEEVIYFITKVKMNQSTGVWIDSTLITSDNFKPVYHSSYNQEREMVLSFNNEVTGYYLDKQTGIKTQISEKINAQFFDSNFYPQLVRFLPLQENYATTISIYDYKPMAKIGVITATIKNTEETSINFKGTNRRVWKVDTTDDISDNEVKSIYYIDVTTRKILKQEINTGERKMVMKLM